MAQPERTAAAPQAAGAILGVERRPRIALPRLPFLSILWSNPKSRAGMLLLSLFIVVAVIGPWISPYSPYDTHFPVMQTPTAAHWLGTTQDGQDVLSELIYGTRLSLIITFTAGAGATFFAVLMAFAAGYLGHWVDDILSFITNVFLVIPGLPLMVVLAAYSPIRGVIVVIGVLMVTGWAWGARVLRSQVLTLRSRDYVIAAQLAGESSWRIMFREILPNMMSLVGANFLGASLAALLGAASLEFLGFGDPTALSWGSMLYWAQNSGALLQGQWAWIFAPGFCIALVGMSLILINFGLDEISNPRLRGDR
jgi:peptide/nickel transport system permease protein